MNTSVFQVGEREGKSSPGGQSLALFSCGPMPSLCNTESWASVPHFTDDSTEAPSKPAPDRTVLSLANSVASPEFLKVLVPQFPHL